MVMNWKLLLLKAKRCRRVKPGTHWQAGWELLPHELCMALSHLARGCFHQDGASLRLIPSISGSAAATRTKTSGWKASCNRKVAWDRKPCLEERAPQTKPSRLLRFAITAPACYYARLVWWGQKRLVLTYCIRGVNVNARLLMIESKIHPFLRSICAQI